MTQPSTAAGWHPWCADCTRERPPATRDLAVTLINGSAYCAYHAALHKPGALR